MGNLPLASKIASRGKGGVEDVLLLIPSHLAGSKGDASLFGLGQLSGRPFVQGLDPLDANGDAATVAADNANIMLNGYSCLPQAGTPAG